MPDMRSFVFLSFLGGLPLYLQAEVGVIPSALPPESKSIDNDTEVREGAQGVGDKEVKLKLDAQGDPVFDLNMLHGNRKVEIANFSELNQVLPGIYNVDLVLNGESIVSDDVEFKRVDNVVIPCLTQRLLNGFNLDLETLPESSRERILQMGPESCVPLEKLIPDAKAVFDQGALRLDISIPQAFLKKTPRGYVNPEFWQQGINAATLQYRLGHYRTTGGFDTHSSYASLRGGINVNGWNFRHFGYFTSQKNYGAPSLSTYDSIDTYVEKALPGIKANLMIGDSYTDGAVTDSIGIRGIQLSSSDLMIPASMRGYSPVVRGVALTNAKVEVFQSGNLIYETVVAPGPFVIDDLYPSANNSNLDVVITEADGTKTSFVVPSSAMPQLVRENQFRYSAAIGKYRNAGSTSNVNVARATAQYGISNYWTAYAGYTVSKNYWATLIGSVYGTDYGAFSGDVEFAKTKLTDFFGQQEFTGSRLRLGYAKLFDSLQSNFDISVYSYNNNYWGLDSKVNYEEFSSFVAPSNYNRERRKIQFTYSQPLGGYGSVYMMLAKTRYWSYQDSLVTAQAGYSNNFTVNNYTFGLNFNYLKSKANGIGDVDSDRFALTLTFPLGRNWGNNLTTSLVHDKTRGNSEQIRFNGVAGEDYRLSYGLYAENFEKQGTLSGGSVQYRSSSAIFDGSVSSGEGSTQLSASVSGGIVLHAGGLTFANQIGDTVGLVHAPGAKGAIVQNSQGIEVDGNGYAVVPYLSAYQRNNILLNVRNVSPDVNFESTTEQVVPYENAVVLIKFETTIGKAALFDISRSDGTPPPFGSVVLLPDGKEAGVVGQGGNSFVYGLQEQGELSVKWGDAPDQQCQVKYELLRDDTARNAYEKQDVSCTSM